MRQLFINVSQLQCSWLASNHSDNGYNTKLCQQRAMETRCFLVPACSRSCYCSLEDQQYGCVKTPGGTPLCHMPRMAVGGFHFLWSSNTLHIQTSYYSHTQKITSQTTRALDFVLLGQWPSISSGTGNIQTCNRLAFCTPHEYKVFKGSPLQLWCMGPT